MVTKLHQNKGTLLGTYMPLDCNATREIYQLMK
ncbi:unknown [Prevotella sp. CAG:873]|nr:unknown [Prevotella sp. CAG:873]